jgi:uncharacterized SAM-binding protein YcdF (DUF218 family)
MEALMNVSKLHYEDLSNDVIDKILYQGLEYNGESAKCALVLGSIKAPIYRIPVAAGLYKTKKIEKILLCGGKVRNTEQGMITEVQLMKNRALELGIPEIDILYEELSMTTKENILCALLPLEREFKLSKIKKVIIITTNYHMRRSVLMAQTYFSSWISIIPCPADDVNTKRNNWWLSEEGCHRAKSEAWKVICYINEGTIPDFKI